MKLGLSVKIDVTKIDKMRLFKGAKGTYLDLTTLIDTENLDQYDNNGFIAQSVTKEERDQKIRTPILGNVKVFYNDAQSQAQPQGMQQARQAAQQAPPQQSPPQQAPPTTNPFDDDIPF